MLAFVAFGAPIAAALAADPVHPPIKILALNSWHKDLPWQMEYERGFKAGLEEAGVPVQIFSEYMDDGRLPQQDRSQSLRDYLQSKYGASALDFIIPESAQAAQFLSGHPDLLPGAQRIYVQPGMKLEGQPTISVNSDFTGAIQEMVRLVRPAKVYVVTDTTLESGQTRLNTFNAALAGLNMGLEVEYLENLPMDDLLDKVSRLPEGSAIFYLLIFNDGAGRNFAPFQAATLLSQRANAPVFSHWRSLLGSGVLGGYMLSGDLVGRAAAATVKSMAFGEPISAGGGEAFGIFYDWRQLKRLGIDSDRLPPGAAVEFYEPSPWETYRWEIVAVSIFIGVLTLLSAVLFIVNRKLKWAMSALTEERGQLERRVAIRTSELNEAKGEAERQATDLAWLNQKLRHETEVKDRFFSIVAHDLRSPFNVLLGMTAIMAARGRDFTQEQLIEYAKTVNDAAEKAFSLLNDLLEWSRLQMKGMSPARERIALHVLIQESLEVARPRAKEKDIKLVNACDAAVAFADPRMVMTVMRNLVSNAIKFTPYGGAVQVTVHDRGEGVEVCVSDTGVGMSEERAAGLFNLAHKSSTVGTAGETGTGLGLPLCKELLEKNGGTLWIESAPNTGTKVRFTLPTEPEPAEPAKIAP